MTHLLATIIKLYIIQSMLLKAIAIAIKSTRCKAAQTLRTVTESEQECLTVTESEQESV